MSDDGILEPLGDMDDSRAVPRQRPVTGGPGPGGGILESIDDLGDATAARPPSASTGPGPGGGILESLDDIGDQRRRGLARRDLFVEVGVKIEHTPSQTKGAIVRFLEGVEVVIRDQLGQERSFVPTPGLFRHDGDLVVLRSPLHSAPAVESGVTASGSIAAQDQSARVARPSRIWVEGIHDAELIERVWGDDLRYEGVVVEQLEGADDLADRVHVFGPADDQRLGILLDHLVDGSKESRIAAQVDDPNVLILGHPYVDIWQAIKPATAGIDAWPVVPKGQPWKQGVIAGLGVTMAPPQFWKHILGKVTTWKDIETPLVNSVEQLIDFVTA